MDKKMHLLLNLMFLIVFVGFALFYEFSDAKNGFYGIENIYFYSYPLYTPKNRDFSAIFRKKQACKKHAKIDDF